MADAAEYTYYDAFDNATITVSTSEELEQAVEKLAATTGGTVLIAPSDETIFLDVRNAVATEDNAVLIRSADPDNPVVLRDVNIMDSSHLTLTDVHIDSGDYGAARSDHIQDMRILDSSNIEVVGISMYGNGTGVVGIDDDAVKGENAVYIASGEDIVFNHNDVSGYFHGIGAAGVTGLEVVGNDIYEMQGDGIRGGGVQDALIADNYLRDFTGSANSVNHADMIQLWAGYPEGVINKDIEISGNILDSGSGDATQGILIQNERFRKEGDPLEGVYNENIYIHENVIHNAQGHGITLQAVDNAVVENNTVLWNEASSVQETQDSVSQTTPPKILLTDAVNSTVDGNVAATVAMNGESQLASNIELDYGDPADPYYAYDHIVGLSPSKNTDLSDLQFVPDSPLNGVYGAETSTWSPSDDPADAVLRQNAAYGGRTAVELSAEYSTANGTLADLDTTQFIWTMDDGTVYEDMSVVHVFDTPGLHTVELTMITEDGATDTETRTVVVGTREIYSTDFSQQGKDMTGWNSVYDTDDPNNTAWSEDGVFTLDGSTLFQLDRSNDQLFFNETLQIDIGFRADEMVDGSLYQMSNAYHLRVTEEGGLRLNLSTDKGDYVIETEDGVITEGETQDISMLFDGPAGSLSLSVDGDVVAETEANGLIGGSGYPLTLGRAFGDDAIGAVEYLELSAPDSVTLVPSVPRDEAEAAEQDDVPPVTEETGETEDVPMAAPEDDGGDVPEEVAEDPEVTDPVDEKPPVEDPKDTPDQETGGETGEDTGPDDVPEETPEEEEPEEEVPAFVDWLRSFLGRFLNFQRTPPEQAAEPASEASSDDSGSRVVLLRDLVPITEVVGDEAFVDPDEDEDDLDLVA